MTAPFLEGWENFYVITGSSAAGLIGLTFVVIALAADSRRDNHRGLRVYVTPMFTGIHNAWDIAVWNTVRKQDDSK